MAESSHAEAVKRFASDLRQIREHRGITAEALHDETKIPMGLIEAFEQSGLFDHPMFNKVYLRSFVRTYVQVVGIPQEVALTSLDDALEGTYRGRLGNEYRGVEEQPSEVSTETPNVAPAVYREPEEDEVTTPPREQESSALPVNETPPVSPHPPQAVSAPPIDAPAEQEITPSPPPQPISTPAPEPVTPQRARVPNRATVAAPGRTPAEREPEEAGMSKGLMYVLAGVVAIAAIGFLLFNVVGNSGGNVIDDAEVGGTEAVAAADTSAAQAASASPPALGDTLSVTIVAANGPVQNMKVTVDDDLRRPYWIELGESKTFTPTQRIVIERQLSKIELQVEGRPYPTDRTDELGRIVITRDSARQVLISAQ